MLAQLPTVPQTELGGWLIAGMGVMTIYWLGRTIYLSHFPAVVPEGGRYVTQDQFASFKDGVDAKLTEMKAGIDRQFSEFKTDLRGQLDKLDSYAHDGFHRTADGQHQLMIGLSRLQGAVEAGASIRRKDAAPVAVD